MAFFKTRCRFIYDFLNYRNPIIFSQFLVSHIRRKNKFWSNWFINNFSTLFLSTYSALKDKEPESNDSKKISLNFTSGMINHFSITQDIQYFRDCRNHFVQVSYNNSNETNSPPLAILLSAKNMNEDLLKKMIEIYGEKGFDILSINLTPNQMLFPCVLGGAMNVVTDLLEYLNKSHRCRPYIFHGFSIGSYIYGEILAQISEQCHNYKHIMNNVKGCLWDSPVDINTIRNCIGKYFYPNNWYYRWKFNRVVRHHFKNHEHDSVVYWNRSRDNFGNPLLKVPNVFFVSNCDILSNPCSLQAIQKTLELNGVPIFQKTWCDTLHIQHFEKYCYEYLYGMILFLNLCNFCVDDGGKYRYSHTSTSLPHHDLNEN